jgi:hypothetical protein
MALYVPNSQYKRYESFDFNGRPAVDASFRHAFIQAQSPMLLGEGSNGGGGAGTVITSFPNTGDGSASNPVTFAPATACGRTFFYDGVSWQHKRNTGITEVTVGDTSASGGANFATLEEALACSPFVRIINDTAVNSLASPIPANVLIYVDPGVNLTFNVALLAAATSVTFRGSSSLASSTITFTSQINCDANTRIYFYDCQVVNLFAGSLLRTTTNNYGAIEAYHSFFVASNVTNSLFGQGSGTEIIFLEIQDCVIESGGDGCELVIGRSDSTTSVVHVRGLSISIFRRPFRAGGIIADTNVNECILSDINIFAPGSTYRWLTSGMITNFKQGTGSISIDLELEGDTASVSNIYVNGLVINSTDTALNNIQTTGNGTVSLVTANTVLSNGIFGGSLSVDAANCKITNCSCERFFINNDRAFVQNVQCNSSLALTNATNTTMGNVSAGGGFSFVNSTTNNFSNCFFPSSATVDAKSNENTFTGGVYEKITVSGLNNTFSGINFTSTFTVDPGANFTHAINCRANQVSWAGADGAMTNLEVTTNIGLSGALTSPRCMITGCRTGTGGVASGEINVNNNADVVISNCIVGEPALPLASITNIITSGISPPPATTTLISNCKTRTAIAASTGVVNCGTF